MRRRRQLRAGICRWILAQKAGPGVAWGIFLTVTLNFLIVAFCIFLMIKLMNKVTRHHEERQITAPTAPFGKLRRLA